MIHIENKKKDIFIIKMKVYMRLLEEWEVMLHWIVLRDFRQNQIE